MQKRSQATRQYSLQEITPKDVDYENKNKHTPFACLNYKEMAEIIFWVPIAVLWEFFLDLIWKVFKYKRKYGDIWIWKRTFLDHLCWQTAV